MKDLLNRYKTCQSCEQLSTELNYLRDVDMKALEDDIQSACEIINSLYDLLTDPTMTRNGESLECAERFIREKYIPKERKPISYDDLPF